MPAPLKRILSPLGSIGLTVALMALAMVLVFAGTVAQVDEGIWTVQKRYFHSFVVTGGPWWLPVLPGGYLIGGLLVVNLVAAHALRWRLAWRRIGVLLVHGGVVLLLGGELITSQWAVETRMNLHEDRSADYAIDIRHVELAVIDAASPEADKVVAFQQPLLAAGAVLRNAALPFAVRVECYYANSDLLGPVQVSSEQRAAAEKLMGLPVTVRPAAEVSGAGPDSGRVNVPGGYVTLLADGRELGTLAVAMDLRPQAVTVAGRPWRIALRPRRDYKPYRIELETFTHDVYPGTDIPRNFASRVHLVDPARGAERRVTIRMNEPLRYAGETFYQHSFLRDDPRASTLLVVANPGWPIPYLAIALVGVGMTVHFTLHLVGFLRRRSP